MTAGAEAPIRAAINSDASVPHEVVIIGGGIAGMAAAWRLRDRDILLLEAEDRVGGRMKSERRGPYWLNLGAHILKPDGIIAHLAGELSIPTIVPPGEFLAAAMHGRVVRARSPVDFLFRLPLSFTARLSLARIGLRMRTAKITGEDGRPNPRLAAQTFAEFLGPMHPDVEALIRVVANRIGGEIRDHSAFAGLHGFEDLWGGIGANIVGSSQRLPEAIQAALGTRVITGARVVRVWQQPDYVTIEYEAKGERRLVSGAACILATEAHDALRVLAGLPTEHSDALSRVRYSPFVVAGIFTQENGPMPWDGLYAVAVPARSFCMFFNPGNALRTESPRAPGGSLVVYSVADRASELLGLSDAVIADRYLKDLYDIFPAVKGIVSEVVVQRWPTAVAVAYPGRGAIQDRLSKPWDRVYFAGDYLHEVGLGIESAAQTGLEAAAAARSRLNAESAGPIVAEMRLQI
jgi:protoporphyrinogen/coproporphyrinogen III oxidase